MLSRHICHIDNNDLAITILARYITSNSLLHQQLTKLQSIKSMAIRVSSTSLAVFQSNTLLAKLSTVLAMFQSSTLLIIFQSSTL